LMRSAYYKTASKPKRYAGRLHTSKYSQMLPFNLKLTRFVAFIANCRPVNSLRSWKAATKRWTVRFVQPTHRLWTHGTTATPNTENRISIVCGDVKTGTISIH
jgi:hypothetical protein